MSERTQMTLKTTPRRIHMATARESFGAKIRPLFLTDQTQSSLTATKDEATRDLKHVTEPLAVEGRG